MSYPQIQQTVIDGEDVRALAEFYRQLLGLSYRPGDEPGADPELKWLVLVDESGLPRLAFQHVDHLPRATWPSTEVPMMMHLDLRVPSREALDEQSARAEALGAELVMDQADHEEEPLRVYADPAGHPFCLFVRAGALSP